MEMDSKELQLEASEKENVTESPFGNDLPNRRLNVIDKEHALNEVYAIGPEGHGGERAMYSIWRDDHSVTGIDFQNGPRNDPNSTEGATDEDLLEIVLDRLQDFQRGPYACEENADAISGIVFALEALQHRVQNRAARGVLGTSKV